MFLYSISAPINILIGFVYLYYLVGVSIFAGILTTVVILTINSFVVKKRLKIQKNYLKVSAKRIKKFSEVYNNISFIKSNNYENQYFNLINSIRKEEIDWNRKYFYNSSFIVSGLFITSASLFVATFGTYIWLGNVPTVTMIFTFISVYDNI